MVWRATVGHRAFPSWQIRQALPARLLPDGRASVGEDGAGHGDCGAQSCGGEGLEEAGRALFVGVALGRHGLMNCLRCDGLIVRDWDEESGEFQKCINCGGTMPKFETPEALQAWKEKCAATRARNKKLKQAKPVEL